MPNKNHESKIKKKFYYLKNYYNHIKITLNSNYDSILLNRYITHITDS